MLETRNQQEKMVFLSQKPKGSLSLPLTGPVALVQPLSGLNNGKGDEIARMNLDKGEGA